MEPQPTPPSLVFAKAIFNAVIAWVIIVLPLQYAVTLYTSWRDKPIVTGWSDPKVLITGTVVAALAMIASLVFGIRARREEARESQAAAERKRMPHLPPPVPRNRETRRPDHDA